MQHQLETFSNREAQEEAAAAEAAKALRCKDILNENRTTESLGNFALAIAQPTLILLLINLSSTMPPPHHTSRPPSRQRDHLTSRCTTTPSRCSPRAHACALSSRSRLTQRRVFQGAGVCAPRRKRWTCTSASAVARACSGRRHCSQPSPHRSSSGRRICRVVAPACCRRCWNRGRRVRTTIGCRLLRICQRLLVQLGRQRLERFEVLAHLHGRWRPFDAHCTQILGADWALRPIRLHKHRVESGVALAVRLRQRLPTHESVDVARGRACRRGGRR